MNLADKAIHHKNPFVRKGACILLQAPRAINGVLSNDKAFASSPPTLANSFPKSGTHLLEQILASFPGQKNYGAFLSSMTSSRTFTERSHDNVKRFVRSIVPNELIRAHLFFDTEIEQMLVDRNSAHYFIYRDLRDVVVSEAHYLFHMNRWHRMHGHFHATGNISGAISLAIQGLPDQSELPYPNIAQRFKRYLGWTNSSSTFAVQYEDLSVERRNETVTRMVDWFVARSDQQQDVDEITQQALARIDSGKSHTFRKGGSAWSKEFTEEHKQEFKDVAGQLLIDLGYESSFDW